jgi:hypothetical protein
MVIRQGFVSNSSSSSFVIFHRGAKLEEIDDEHVKIMGDYLSEGRDYFRPDEMTIKYLKTHPEILDKEELLLVYEYLGFSENTDGIDGETLKILSDLPYVKVHIFEAANWSCYNFEQFEESYISKKDRW